MATTIEPKPVTLRLAFEAIQKDHLVLRRRGRPVRGVPLVAVLLKVVG